MSESAETKILCALMKDSRRPLTDIGKELNIPTTTVYEYMRKIREKVHFTIIPKPEGRLDLFVENEITNHAQQLLDELPRRDR